ncbi:rhomboid family intramembrane serine protease [Flagellimonas algicola]|uniref:Rhomboid family intramembrane serine protease n=1 Tax=Flagellimonas algicola TaxID=2583815 RepID=A0ABY2WQ21_9FLAO|nr:rhomboid family intramembrane serine protease [Allomuricauda algicola]TMU57091.1 rhomboid family intramembrane serine protease [Allomuricauda algicola]
MASGGLKYYLARLNIAEKLIGINVLVFIASGLLAVLIGIPKDAVLNWFELPEDVNEFITKPWTLVTYSFFHGSLGHIFWNMLLLYFFGRIFLNLFDNQRFLNVYFLGVIFGGLLFMLGYNIFPMLLSTNAILIGASAGVSAVLIFVCAYIPSREVRIIFFNIKLWQLAVFVVLKDVISLSMGSNVGGMLAHFGGILLGYVYATQLLKGNDIGSGFTKLWNGLAQLFKPREKKAPLKTVYKKKTSKNKTKVDYDKAAHQKKIDDILDKISKSGYESLSKAEKDFLFKAGKED